MPDAPRPAIRDAATVMLVRDDEEGRLEVFMLRRNLNSDFVGGAYVFPGGAVDPHDASPEVDARCEDRDDAGCSELLSIDKGGLAFWVAAVRECFEEAGVLLAHRPGEPVLSLADPAMAGRFEEHRAALNAGTRRLIDICEQEDLLLTTGEIHYFAHWITPEGPPRRFDTRFLVAAAPPEQVALHDDNETIANTWIRPSVALEQQRAGTFEMILPTIANLQAIDRFPNAKALLAHAAAIENVPRILPRIVHDASGEGMRILLPGDDGYEEAGLGADATS